jgi:hypothetical protein
MSEKNFYLSRRNFLGLTAAAVLPLSACQTAVKTPGKVVGASAVANSNVQAIRSANGLAGLNADPMLERAALQQAAYMASAGRMAHTTGWGRGFASRVRDNEIHGLAAENIAMGHMDIDQLFARWMACRHIGVTFSIGNLPVSVWPMQSPQMAVPSAIGHWFWQVSTDCGDCTGNRGESMA